MYFYCFFLTLRGHIITLWGSSKLYFIFQISHPSREKNTHIVKFFFQKRGRVLAVQSKIRKTAIIIGLLSLLIPIKKFKMKKLYIFLQNIFYLSGTVATPSPVINISLHVVYKQVWSINRQVNRSGMWIRIRSDLHSFSDPELDLDPHSPNLVEPDPDPHTINADPHPWNTFRWIEI